MARQYRTGLIITGDASGGLKAIQATEKELNQLNQRFERGGRQARQFGDDAGRAGRQLDGVTDAAGEGSRELDVLRGAAVSVGAALAGAFAASNLAGQARMIADTNSLAQSLQVSTRTLQQWQFAGKSVGLEADKIGDIFKDVSDKIGDFASTGGGEAADLFENLNLNVRELQSLSPDQQILRIAEAIGELEDPSQRTFYFESLGDEMVRLQPLLANGAEGLRDAAEMADALGVAMDDIEVQRAVEAAESMDQLQGVAQGLANTLIADLGPGLADATANVIDFVDAMGGADEIVESLMVVGGGLAAMYGGKLALAIGKKTAALVADIKATDAATLADSRAAQAATARTAEILRVAQSEQAAAQRALANARATAAATGSTANRSKALTQLAAANQRVAQAEAVSTAAMNTHTAAMQRASVASRALAGASRAASGALALVGGPLGLLVGAGGLLYMFRDELGLTQHRIGLTEDELESFREELGEMSGEDLGQSLASLNASLEEATLKAAAAREEVAKLRAEDDGYSITGVGNLSEQVAGINALAEAQEKLRGLEQQRNESRIELWGRWSSAVVDGTNATDENSESNDHNTETIVSQTQAAAELTKQLEQQATGAQSLVDELYPLQASQRQYAEDKASLVQYALQENKSNEWLAESMRRLDDSYRNAGTAAEAYGLEGERAAEGVESAFDASLTVMERGVERLDDAFVDQWRGLLDGSQDAMDSLEDILLDSMAQIAHNLTTRQLIIPIQAMITGEGQAGGGILGGSQSGGMDMGTLAKGGKWAYDQFFGGASAGAAGTAAVGYGGGGWASSVGTNTYGGWAGNASGAASASGGSLASGAMSGLYTAGAGMAGSWAGSQVGGMVSDKQANSNVGATAGTAIGAYVGSIFPVVGTYLGAAIGGFLGGVGDTLFGSPNNDLDIALQRRPSEQGHRWDNGIVATGGLGAVGFDASNSHEIKDLWDVDEAQSVVDAIAQMDTMVAGLAQSSDELARMQEIAQGYYGETSTPGDIAGIMTERYGQVFEEISGALGEYVRGLEGNTQEIVQQAALANGAYAVMEGAVESLNLQLDMTQVSAYEASAGLAELVGGTQNLASLQQGYYDAFYSEDEKIARLGEDLAARFGELGLELPTTERGVRNLVEGLEQATESGREQYAAILQLVPELDRYVEAMEAQGSALQDAFAGIILPESSIDTIQGALSTYQQVMTTADDVAKQREAQLADERKAIASLQSLLRELALGEASTLSTPARLATARGQWSDLVDQAGGDPDAVSALSGASRDYLDLARDNASTSLEYARAFGQVTGDIAGLEDEYGESVHELGSIESIASDQLALQDQARETLVEQLTTQIGMLDGIHTFSALLGSLPAHIADQLEGIIASPSDNGRGDVLPDGEYVDASGLSPAGQAINDIYNDVLNRNADQLGLEWYLDRMREGASLSDIRGWIEDDKAHGAHRDGLNRVPFDEYRAILHKDELVATAEEAPAVRALLNGDLPMRMPVPVPMPLGGGTGGGASYSELLEEIRAMRQELERVRGYARTTADSASQSADLHRRWEYAGLPESRV